MATHAGAAAADLTALINIFDRNPIEYRKLIRQRMESNPDAFYENAIAALKEAPESRGSQYLLTLLVTKDYLLRALCDPALDREQATLLARTAVGIDPTADVKLVRLIACGFGSREHAAAGRVLDILGDVVPLSRLVSSLAPLLRHRDAYLRSKAVLIAGRAKGTTQWAKKLLADPDSRIRANAVEALWDAEGTGVREILLTAASDWNNRVAGNALIALYRMGDASSIPKILAMASHDSMLFRSTAAWIMGTTGSTRFRETLAGMLCDDSPAVRKRAFAALQKIKLAAQSHAVGQWTVSGRMTELHRLVIEVDAGGKPLPDLLTTHFLLTEDGRCIQHYATSRRNLPLSHSGTLHSKPPEELPESIARAHVRLPGRYEIRYQPLNPEAREIRVLVQHPDGAGETRIPVFRPRQD